MPLHHSTADDPILRAPAVARMFDVHPNTLRAMVQRGEFPAPLLLSRGISPRIGWRRSTLIEHRDALTREAEIRTRQAAAAAAARAGEHGARP